MTENKCIILIITLLFNHFQIVTSLTYLYRYVIPQVCHPSLVLYPKICQPLSIPSLIMLPPLICPICHPPLLYPSHFFIFSMSTPCKHLPCMSAHQNISVPLASHPTKVYHIPVWHHPVYHSLHMSPYSSISRINMSPKPICHLPVMLTSNMSPNYSLSPSNLCKPSMATPPSRVYSLYVTSQCDNYLDGQPIPIWQNIFTASQYVVPIYATPQYVSP